MTSPPPRVAVVTTSTKSWENELWVEAASACDDLLLMCGDDGVRLLPELPVRSRTLPQVDFGRGLIYRHIRGLGRTLREFQPDIVHLNAELWSVLVTEARILGRTWRSRTGRRASFVVHGAENLWRHGGPLEARIRDSLVAGAAEFIDGYLSWNRAGADHIASLTSGRIPTAVVPAVVPSREFWDATWAGDTNSEFNILLVGRAIPEKGFDRVIRAAARMKASRGVSVTLCGEGPELGSLVQLANSLGVELHAAGFRGQAELIETMRTHQVLVQPSQSTPDWSEQFGRSVAEAMAVGLPCLASDSGALPEVLGANGDALFSEHDVDGIASRLDRLASSPDALADLARVQCAESDRYRPGVAAREVVHVWDQARRHGRT